MKGDVGWLRNSLASALGWDEQLTEGVAEAIAAAQSRKEVEELAQVFYRRSQLPCQFTIKAQVLMPTSKCSAVCSCRTTWEEETE